MKTYYIKATKKYGRGIYASRDLKPGDVIMQCETLVLSPKDTIAVNKTTLQFYTFKFDADRDCLVLGDGELFNHSVAPSAAYSLVPFDGRKVMVFQAVKNIKRGQQIFIDYTADTMVDSNQYKINLVG